MATRSVGLQLLTLLLLFESSIGYLQGTIVYPIRYVDRSIDLGIGIDEFKVPTGRCDCSGDTDLSLILPRSYAPRTLYSGFIASNRVTCLSLRDNLIEHLSIGSFDCLPDLIYLDLSKNRIQFSDILSFGNHDKLKTLIVDENSLPGENSLTIDRSSYFPRVEHLYLRKNNIRQLRFSLRQQFPYLTHLYLSDNQLNSASLTDLDLPIGLKHLHLERNVIRQVDSRIVRQLYFLFLDGNEIGKICSTNCWGSYINLRGASKLRFLSLIDNAIGNIDRDSFTDLYNLRSLVLRNNRLESITPGTFDSLRELRDLSLSQNRLACIPIFHNAKKLKSLTLDNNQITRIEANSFRGLIWLKWLSLSNNRICIVESNAFGDLEMLEELNLSNNELRFFSPDWISSNTRLRSLDLRYNKFTSFENMYLYNVVSLKDLYMQGNPLSKQNPPRDGIFSRNVKVHTNHGITVSPSPCYVICDFELNTLSQYERASDYSI